MWILSLFSFLLLQFPWFGELSGAIYPGSNSQDLEIIERFDSLRCLFTKLAWSTKLR